jgi:putative transposase
LLKDRAGNTQTLPVKDVERLYAATADIDMTSREAVPQPSANLAEFSAKQLEAASMRLAALSEKTDTVHVRSRQRWRNKIAGATSVDALNALIDRKSERGNRTPRLPVAAESLAMETIGVFYNSPECRTRTATYAKYRTTCDAVGVAPMSYVSFCKRVKAAGDIRSREGKRMAYQASDIPLYLDYGHPLHGVRPHDVCYIDHTVISKAAPLHLENSNWNENTAKPHDRWSQVISENQDKRLYFSRWNPIQSVRRLAS